MAFKWLDRSTRPGGPTSARMHAVRSVALLVTAVLLLPLVLPALSGAPTGAQESTPNEQEAPPGSTMWPPEAWHDGDWSSLSLVELALLASDSPPTLKNRAELERGLAPLEDQPEAHTELTRVVLEGLAQARWHQVQAMRHLSDEQRAIVAQADPDGPLPEGWDGVMATVDHQELAKALLALEKASAQALAIFERLENKHDQESVPRGAAHALSAATGTPLPPSLPDLGVDAPSVELTAALVAQVTGAGLDPKDLTHLEETLDRMPPEARSAVHVILEGLVPFAAGAPQNPGPPLVRLGAAVDAAEETLLLWSTAALAEQIHYVQSGPGIVIPDADAEKPPLHFGVPRLRDPGAPLPPAPSLPDAVQELALAFGDHETAQDAEERARPVMEVLPQSQQDAVAQMLAQAARYIRAQEAAGEVPVPGALAQNPDRLPAWVGYLDDGLPAPGSLEAQDLLAARSYLEAQLEAALSREDLMTAIQDAVMELTPQPQASSSASPLPEDPESPDVPAPMMPMSGPAQQVGVECLEDLGIMDDLRPYLVIEPCGGDTQWEWEEHNAVFVIDMGGNDTYQGPFARAPFEASRPGSVPDVTSPLAIHLDLGGSDFYNATGHDCVLGAVCDAGGLAILVDWDKERAVTENRFLARDKSLGYAVEGGTGLLVERVGANSSLFSTYESGDQSQGVTESLVALLPGGVGALMRLVGQESNATGTFTAGDFSQGANTQRGSGNLHLNPGVGALLNIAGPGAQAPDHYTAGANAQGATAIEEVGFSFIAGAPGYGAGLFADLVGPGGQSDDVYEAVDKSRGYGVGGYFLDMLLPESVEQENLIGTTPSVDSSSGPMPGVPDPDDPGQPGAPGLPEVDPEDATRPAASTDVRSTGVRSSNDDTFNLTVPDAIGHGWGPAMVTNGGNEVLYQTLFLNLGGNNTYVYGGGELAPCTVGQWPEVIPGSQGAVPEVQGLPANECWWQQPTMSTVETTDIGPPTGMDTAALQDSDGDFFPYFLEALLGAPDPDDDPDWFYPTGRRVVVDLGARYPFLNETHAFVLSLVGDSVYGTGFSSAVLMDLGGDNVHLGRTATATGPLASGSDPTFPRAAQELLSFTLDLDGDDVYHSSVNGSLGFGAGGASGILFDLGGNDNYTGTSFTQGVGVSGGLGVLVDQKSRTLDPSLDDPQVVSESHEVNRFWADGPPAQGHGGGGVGVLVADGDHNEFDDGALHEASLPVAGNVTAGGYRLDGTGASVNLGENVGPRIDEWGIERVDEWGIKELDWKNTHEEAFPRLEAGKNYTFVAKVTDDDDDRVQFCWTFHTVEEDPVHQCEWPPMRGTVESRIDFQWDVVPTNAREQGIHEELNFTGDLEVSDAGGKSTHVDFGEIPLRNVPLQVGEKLRGPSETVIAFSSYAFQLPFTPFDDEGNLRLDLPGRNDDAVEVVLGDGDPITFTATGVDWASAEWGASIRLPDAFPDGYGPIFRDGRIDDIIGGGSGSVLFIQDTPAASDPEAPATLVVDFDGPRQIREVAMRASLVEDGFSVGPVRLLVEGVGADGSLHLLGHVNLTDGGEWVHPWWDLPGFPELRGLVVRQLDSDDEERRSFRIDSISARGPGAVMSWNQDGCHEVNYSVLNRFGGRNGTTEMVSVGGGSCDSPGSGGGAAGGPATNGDVGVQSQDDEVNFVVLNNVAGRGPVRHASVAQDTSYPDALTVTISNLLVGQQVCIQIDDSRSECSESNGQFGFSSHTWTESKNHTVTATLEEEDGVELASTNLTTIHVEEAVDLPGVLFLALEPGRQTWYEGLEYQAIVDRGGDDRYFGRVAASIPTPTADALPGVPVPQLVLDAGGDDLYVSSGTRTQAFATHFGVALLVDADGDDVYVAGGEAQAAATRGGVAALVSFGGRDHFNPVPAGHPAATGASATNKDPTPLEVFRGGRAIGIGPDMVQGATEDGIALLVTAGGPALLHAGDRAQGYGAHDVPNVEHYAVPGANEECGPIQLFDGDPSNLGLDPTVALCLLGILNFRDPTDPDDPWDPTTPGNHFYDFDEGGGRPPGRLGGPDPNHFWCRNASLEPWPCPDGTADSSPLSAFLTSGPRYGPGLGAALRLDGPAFYHAGMNAQGMAGPDGRGLLWNVDGASALLAGERSQAYSRDGLAGTVLGGAGVMRLGQEGQAVFREADETDSGPVTPLVGPEGGLTQSLRASVLFMVGPDERRCAEAEAPTCGPGEEGNEIFLQQDDPRDTPAFEVSSSTNVVFDEDPMHVTVAFDGDDDHDVAAFAVAYPDWTGDDQNGFDCEGSPMGAPALIHDGSGTDEFDIELDPKDLVAGTDPLLPAGCTEVHVFARAQDSLLNGWGHGTTSVLFLPPPRIPLDDFGGEPLIVHGEDQFFEFPVAEPLAQAREDSLGVKLCIENITGCVVELDHEWVGDSVVATWEPDPGQTGDGEYTLQAGFWWTFDDDSDVVKIPLRTIEVQWLDPGPVELLPGTPNPLFVGSARELELLGTTIHLGSLRLRLVEPVADPDAVDPADATMRGIRVMDGNGECGDQETRAVVDLPSIVFNQEQSWRATFCLLGHPDVLEGDGFFIQYSVDLGLNWDWLRNATKDVQQVVFAGNPPEVKQIVSIPGGFPGSTAGGGESDRVGICILVGHNGVGVLEEDVLVTIVERNAVDNFTRLEVNPAELDLAACPDPGMNEEVFTYEWYDPGRTELPQESEYRIFVLVRDRVGSLFDHNPGLYFPLDREDPSLGIPDIQRPWMTPFTGPFEEVSLQQKAVQPGDDLGLRVRATDPNLVGVTAAFPGHEENLAPDPDNGNSDDWVGTIEVPFLPTNDGTIPIVVQAVDMAGNTAIQEVPLVYHRDELEFEDEPLVEEFSDSLRVSWELNRPLAPGDPERGDGARVVLLDPADGNAHLQTRMVEATPADGSYSVSFPGLQPNKDHALVLQVWDGANWTLERVLFARTLGLPGGADLGWHVDDGPTYSGEVRLPGHLLAGETDVAGALTLHLDDPGQNPDSEPVPFLREREDGSVEAAASVELELNKGKQEGFVLIWDSTGLVEVGEGAQTVTLYARFSDGSWTLVDNVTLRIDNTPPRDLALDVSGPAPNNGWYNGTVVVGVDFIDDTPPFTHRLEVRADGVLVQGPLQQETVAIQTDGIYEVRFTVADGAIPPNEAQFVETVRVDRSLPILNVTSGLEDPWTNATRVPLNVEASDDVSGLQGVRVRAGGLPWSPWIMDPEEVRNVTLAGLPEGEHWIDVEARDAAGNVRQQAFSVILDRTPPELLDARWVGLTDGDEPVPVLHVVARDPSEGDTRTSGLDAIRFAPTENGPWSDWFPTGASGTFGVNETRSGAVWLQLRDRATNTAQPVRVDEAPLEPGAADPDAAPPDAPASALLRELDYAPKEGSPSTPFTFSVRVHPLAGALPDRVVLHVAGTTHEMEWEGPVLQGGARLYVATATLPPTGFEPHTFIIAAAYGDHVVESAARVGPTVLKLGTAPTADAQADTTSRFPIPAVPAVLLLIALLALLAVKRWLPRSRLNPNWYPRRNRP